MSGDPGGVGLAMRGGLLEGIILPVDPGFSRVLAAFPYGADEVTQAFDALVDVDGRTAGRSISLDDLSEEWAAALADLGLVTKSSDGSRAFTEKGTAMQALLDEYANRERVWQSFLHSPDVALEVPAPNQTLATEDVRAAVETADHALRLALEATTGDFETWQMDCAGERRFGDEFSLTAADIANLEPAHRLAYLSRLIRTACLFYGLEMELGHRQLGSPSRDPHSLRATIMLLLGDPCKKRVT
jgi:hypothetical protein